MIVENLYTPNCIRTVSGIYINVCDPQQEQIIIEDIAHALSMQCRFGAHLPVFYSVAQHSLDVAFRVESKHRLAALLHDASEAYLLDIPSPVKAQLKGYKAIEDTLMRVIASKFEFQYPLSASVKNADKAALEYEWDAFMLGGSWRGGVESAEAKNRFLSAYSTISIR